MKKVEVGLLLLVENHPGKGVFALLQKRGAFDYETMQPEHYAGVAQITVHGGVNPGETIINALMRETEEELGSTMRELIERQFANAQEIHRHETDARQVHTFVLRLPHFPHDLIQLHRSSDGIVKIFPDEVEAVTTTTEGMRLEGYHGVKVAMFADEKEVLKKAFRLASGKK